MVQSICTAQTLDRDTFPFMENVYIPENVKSATCMTVSTIVQNEAGNDANASLSDTPLTDLYPFSNIHWAKEQSLDKDISRVLHFLRQGYVPNKLEMKSESLEVCKYFRELDKLTILNGILYRTSVLNHDHVRQLVLPAHFRDTAFRYLHTDLGHHGRE